MRQHYLSGEDNAANFNVDQVREVVWDDLSKWRGASGACVVD